MRHGRSCPRTLGALSDFKPSRIRLALACSHVPDLEISTAHHTQQRQKHRFGPFARTFSGHCVQAGILGVLLLCFPERHGSVYTCYESRGSACRRTCAGFCCARSAPGCSSIACRFCTRFASGTRARPCPQSLLLSWSSCACCSQLFCGARAGPRTAFRSSRCQRPSVAAGGKWTHL